MDESDAPLHEPDDVHNQDRLRRVMVTLASVLLFFLVSAFAYLGWLVRTTPGSEALQQIRVAQPTVLLAADGKPYATFRLQQQQWVDLAHISPWVIDALIATEDRRFYEHGGVDFGRTVAAVFHTLSGDAQGGSTLTQQLARNVFPEEIGRSRTLNRKLKEIVAAIKIERAYNKSQILETYLNTMPFLYNVYGIEMAARTYFDKPAAHLDPLEAATLVGMLKGTYYYNPVVNPERAKTRRNLVLTQLVRTNHLTEAQYQALREQPLQVHFKQQPEVTDVAPHFTEYVRKWLAQWAEQNDRDIYADGLIVHTTLDRKLQEAAARAVQREADALQSVADVEWSQPSRRVGANAPGAYVQMRNRIEPFRYFWNSQPGLLDSFVRESAEFRKAVSAGERENAVLAKLKSDGNFMSRLRADKTRLEAGFVAMDPATGAVKAWVGSRDFQRDRYDHVVQAERQPGSTFKPIVYAAALERGLRPDHVYYDNPTNVALGDGTFWTPTDMSSSTGQPMTLRDGLVHSKNTITTQVMQDVGVPSIVSLARTMGVTQSKLDPVPSLALGTSPVTLLEMVNAYSTIASVGEYRKPLFVTRITDRDGKVLAEFGQAGARALAPDTAVELIDMMRGVVTQGTGTAVKTRFGMASVDVAGKTGTTQNNTDGWFILMHPHLVAGAWVGFNDTRVTMRSDYWGQGGHNAILLVGDFFRDALNTHLIDLKAQFPRPDHPPMTIVDGPRDLWNDQVDHFWNNGNSALPPIRAVGPSMSGAGLNTGSDDSYPARSAEEIARAMSAMGRDPVTGQPLERSPPPPPPRYDYYPPPPPPPQVYAPVMPDPPRYN